MNKLLLSLLLTSLFGVFLMAQTKITGTVKSSNSSKSLYDATITLIETGESVKSDRIGYYQFVNVEEGEYTLLIVNQGYKNHKQNVVVDGKSKIEIDEIVLEFDPMSEDIGVITLSNDELASDESSSQASIGLLQASRDVFLSTAAFEFGSNFFRTRGYENKYQDILFNGVRMNKIDNDRVDFSNWGGLNDITRRPDEIVYGINPSDYAFGDARGVTAINPKPSVLRKGFSLAYSLTNRSYRQRVLGTYNSGLNEKGWGFTISGARRWAEEGLIEGTLYDSWAYFVAIEKRINNNHSLVLSGFGAPTRRTGNSPNTEEIVGLRGIDYNSFWGYQNGEIRNERIRRIHEPIFQMAHNWKLSNKSRLNTTISYQFGSSGSSRLDWFNAPNPTPRRRTPSEARADGASESTVNEIINRWQNDPNWYQLNWESLYNHNNNVNLQGLPAAYALVDDRNDDRTLSFHTNFKTKLTENVDVLAIANYQTTNSELYRELDDLLGANFAANFDDFDDFEFDLNNPGRRVLEGERYQYEYELNREVADIYLRTDINLNQLEIVLGMKASYTRANRDGKYLNQIYQENSLGESPHFEFWDFGIKSQFVYKLNGRNYLQLNGAYYTVAPTMNEIFPNARVNESTIPGLKSAKVTSGDFSYILQSPKVKARATAYATLFDDEIETSFAFVNRNSGSDSNSFGALVISDVEKQHLGLELALEYQLSSTITATSVASIGEYTYAGNGNQYIFFSGEDDFLGANIVAPGVDDRGTAFINNYRVAEGPQQAYSVGIEYRSPKFWWIGVTGNFFAENFASIANIRRTRDFVTDFTNPLNPLPIEGITEEDVRNILRQEEFSSEFMLNLNAGRTFRIGEYFAGVSLNVNNVLNNENYKTGGFEQARLSNYNLLNNPNLSQTFGNRHWYNQGTTFFLNIFFRF